MVGLDMIGVTYDEIKIAIYEYLLDKKRNKKGIIIRDVLFTEDEYNQLIREFNKINK